MKFVHWTNPQQPATVPQAEIVEGGAEFYLPTGADPFLDAAVEAVVTAPSGHAMTLPCFWAGGSVMKFRYTVGEVGRHQYRFQVTKGPLEILSGSEGTFEGGAERTVNRLLRRGAPRMSANRRYLERGDAEPFLWLADSWWFGMSTRIRYPEEFTKLVRDRAEKGFSVIQFAMGFACDIAPYDPRERNEAGHIWEDDYRTINPAYFEHADQRLGTLVDYELVPNIVGLWGYYLPFLGREKAKLHWRYLIARYGALPVTWTLCGEVRLVWYEAGPEEREALLQEQREGWAEVGRFLQDCDPWNRLVTCHVGPKPRGVDVDPLTDMSVLDFHFIQPGHSDFDAVQSILQDLDHARNALPSAPVMVGECCFEGMHGAAGPKSQRNLFWMSICAGMPGYSYGVDALWQMNRREDPFGVSVPGHIWGNAPWDEAYQWQGSANLGLGAKLLRELPWQDFEPRSDWLEPHGSPAQPRQPMCCGIPGKLRLIYIPVNLAPWAAKPVVRQLDGPYSATYINPIDGSRHPLGRVEPDASGNWVLPHAPVLHDWVLLLEADTTPGDKTPAA